MSTRVNNAQLAEMLAQTNSNLAALTQIVAQMQSAPAAPAPAHVSGHYPDNCTCELFSVVRKIDCKHTVKPGRLRNTHGSEIQPENAIFDADSPTEQTCTSRCERKQKRAERNARRSAARTERNDSPRDAFTSMLLDMRKKYGARKTLQLLELLSD